MRRMHVPNLKIGEITLPATEAHHARNVLRLPEGAEVELFDSAGQTACATLRYPNPTTTFACVIEVTPASGRAFQFTIASAVPKGDRADWMIEKLSELGTAEFIPLRTARSVVHPEGAGKLDRWRRIAMESAKQCHRNTVMEIKELTPLAAVISPGAWYLSTVPGSFPAHFAARENTATQLTMLVGPEGGWTPEEISLFDANRMPAVSLGPTILRIETAVIAAAVFASSIS